MCAYPQLLPPVWKPLDNGRSALDQLQECAQSPDWYRSILEARNSPKFDPAEMQKMMAERAQWPTIDACEKVCHERAQRLLGVIRTFPNQDLEKTISLPFAENQVFSMADVMLFLYWNLTYHLGQINYIQTLYGDFEMR